MSRSPRIFIIAVLFFGPLILLGEGTERLSPKKVANFFAKDHEGKRHELYQQSGAKAIVLIFTSVGCPIAEKSVPKIKELRNEFGPKGVVFWLVDSNPDDDLASTGQEAKDFRIDMPILLDHSQAVALSVSAKRTAEAFCIEPKTWTLFYRGAIDDQLGYGTEKGRVNHPYLSNALNSFLSGKKVSPERTDVKGCLIQFTQVHKE